MRADFRVVLDACVLIPMPLADTLLRMAEAPRLYLPRWSQRIMDEVTRNLIAKWDMPFERVRRREEELRRHFPAASVQAWEIDVQAPSAFLRGLYDLDPGLSVGKLHEQALAIGVSLQRLLLSLSKNVPGFVEYFCEEQGIGLPRFS